MYLKKGVINLFDCKRSEIQYCSCLTETVGFVLDKTLFKSLINRQFASTLSWVCPLFGLNIKNRILQHLRYPLSKHCRRPLFHTLSWVITAYVSQQSTCIFEIREISNRNYNQLCMLISSVEIFNNFLTAQLTLKQELLNDKYLSQFFC